MKNQISLLQAEKDQAIRESGYIKQGQLMPLTLDAANEIAQWEYEAPYDAYSFKGFPNGYLLDESTWGTEQFCLMGPGVLLGQVAC